MVILPLGDRIELVRSWSIVCTILAGTLVHMNAPETPFSELYRPNPNDRWSTYFMILAAALLTITSVVEFAHFHDFLPSIQSFSSIAGLILFAMGLALRWWTIRTLGEYFTARVRLEEEHEIIDVGPYKYLKIRHPAYLGTLLTAFGIPLVLHSFVGVLVFGLVFIPVYVYRVRVEEAALVRKLGEPYEQFVRRTYSLLPIVY
jgi:protein-S-isoprenylcysteine O-methyltransferase Ste14